MVQKLKLEELGRLNAESFRASAKIPLTVVLDNVRSMHNVGAIFRTADAFRVEKVLLCGITPQPPHREIQKAALGATETVVWAYEKDLLAALQALKQENKTLVGIEQTTGSISLEEFGAGISSEKSYAVVLGNEVDGLSEQGLPLYDAFVEIPQFGTKHSLNVSVCGGIVMHQFFMKMKDALTSE